MINIKTLEINSQTFVMNSDIEKGLLRGSIWQNLFEPYKYVLDKFNTTNEEEQLKYMLQVYTFASIELTLFIATHPNNMEAMETLKRINMERKRICEYLENKYGAIDSKSVVVEGYFKKNKGVIKNVGI